MVSQWEGAWDVNTAQDSQITTRMIPAGKPQAMLGMENMTLRAEVVMDAMVTTGQGLPMIVGLEMGELVKSNPDRPSLILCRKGNRRLWDIAKETGSTVEKIMDTNNL